VTSASVRIDPGTAVGPYVVERLLAQGGMSVIYLARARASDPEGGRVVLKMLLPELATAAMRVRLQREARALAAVDHPGVVRVHDTGEHDGAPWIAMDYVRGTDLKRLLADRGALSPETAVQHAVEATEALAAAHAAGVIHRDLKPSNLIITPEGRVVIVDFGIARRRGEPKEGDVVTSAREVLGTLAYLAPEQLEHGLADERSDIWGLGCVLYEMLVEVPPFGRGGSTTTAAILRDEPEFPPSVPATLVHIIGSCLRKSSFARVASTRELLAMLRDAHVEARTKRASMRPSGAPSSSMAAAPAKGASSAPRQPSSSMRVAATRGRVKGTALRAGVAWFAETYGEPGMSRVLELASPALAQVLRKDDFAFGLIASGWYETSLVGELLALIDRVASPADPEAFAAKIADAIANDNVNGVYRALFRLVASPPLLEANSQRVWRTYVDEGTLTVNLKGPGAFEARVRGWTRHDAVVCRMIQYMIERLLRAVGYSGLVVERTQCVSDGDPHCTFEGNWLPRA
jgi:tRNA A-37 threonylcarbamoyl transferase component Bud32